MFSQNLFLSYFLFILVISANVQNYKTDHIESGIQTETQNQTHRFYGSLEPRIINGSRALPGQFPYQISLAIRYQHRCGGSVLNDSFVITAAHCMFIKGRAISSRILQVRAGDINLKSLHMKTFRVKRYWVHEQFDPNVVGKGYDIALIELSENFGLNRPGKSTTGKIVLANRTHEAGETCIVSGWGLIRENPDIAPRTLMYTRVQIVGKPECRRRYLGKKLADVVCALNPYSDSCSGDSGGPLVCTNNKNGLPELVGIVSWGSGCYSKYYPGVYTDVYHYRNWILTRSAATGLTAISYLSIVLIVSINVLLK